MLFEYSKFEFQIYLPGGSGTNEMNYNNKSMQDKPNDFF